MPRAVYKERKLWTRRMAKRQSVHLNVRPFKIWLFLFLTQTLLLSSSVVQVHGRMNTSPNPNKSTEQEESKDGHGNSNENENELEIENENNGGVRAEAFDDRTLLDTFGEAAKEYLTHRVIPKTDAMCKWDWRSARCEPFCECHWKPKFGDYHLGRSCRTRTKDNDNDILLQNCSLPPETPYVKVVVKGFAKAKIASKIARKIVDQKWKNGTQKVTALRKKTCQQMICSKPATGTATDPTPLTWKDRFVCGSVPPRSSCDNAINTDVNVNVNMNTQEQSPFQEHPETATANSNIMGKDKAASNDTVKKRTWLWK